MSADHIKIMDYPPTPLAEIPVDVARKLSGALVAMLDTPPNVARAYAHLASIVTAGGSTSLGPVLLAVEQRAATPLDAAPVLQVSTAGETITLLGYPGKPSGIEDTIDRADTSPEFKGAIEGVTSLILALHTAGVDVRTPRMKTAIGAALEAISNNLGD